MTSGQLSDPSTTAQAESQAVGPYLRTFPLRLAANLLERLEQLILPARR